MQLVQGKREIASEPALVVFPFRVKWWPNRGEYKCMRFVSTLWLVHITAGPT